MKSASSPTLFRDGSSLSPSSPCTLVCTSFSENRIRVSSHLETQTRHQNPLENGLLRGRIMMSGGITSQMPLVVEDCKGIVTSIADSARRSANKEVDCTINDYVSCCVYAGLDTAYGHSDISDHQAYSSSICIADDRQG